MNQPSATSTSAILLKDPACSFRIINVSSVSHKVRAAFGPVVVPANSSSVFRPKGRKPI